MFKRKWMIKDLLVKLEKCLCKRFFSKLKPRAGNDSPMYASDPVFKKYKLMYNLKYKIPWMQRSKIEAREFQDYYRIKSDEIR